MTMILVREAWSAQAESMLKNALNGQEQAAAQKTASGIFRFYRVFLNREEIGATLLQQVERGLNVECYEGRSLVRFMRAMLDYAKKAGFQFVVFFSYNKSIVNIYQKKFGAQIFENCAGYEAVKRF